MLVYNECKKFAPIYLPPPVLRRNHHRRHRSALHVPIAPSTNPVTLATGPNVRDGCSRGQSSRGGGKCPVDLCDYWVNCARRPYMRVCIPSARRQNDSIGPCRLNNKPGVQSRHTLVTYGYPQFGTTWCILAICTDYSRKVAGRYKI